MSPVDVRRAQAAIFQPHYTRAMEAEAFARNELRMSQGLSSEPIASKAYWASLKDDLGGQLIPFYKVVGKYYVYFIYGIITLCVIGSVLGFCFRITTEFTANGCTPRLGVTLCQSVYHVMMVPIDFVKAGYNGVVDHQEKDGPSFSYLENLINHLRMEFVALSAQFMTLHQQLSPFFVAGQAGALPPPYTGNDGMPPPPPLRHDSNNRSAGINPPPPSRYEPTDRPAGLNQLSNLDLPDFAALFGEEAACEARWSRDETRMPSAPMVPAEPLMIRRHVRHESTHVRNASLSPPPRQVSFESPARQPAHNPDTVYIRSALGPNANVDGLPAADMSPCSASSLFPESPNQLRTSMGFSMDPSTPYPKLPPLPAPHAPGTIGNPFPQATIGTPLGEFMPAPGLMASRSSPTTRPVVAGIKRPRARPDESDQAAEAAALLPDDMLPLQHLEKYHRRTSDVLQPDRPAPLLSHLDHEGGLRAVGDAIELATGLRRLPLADELGLPAPPPLPGAPCAPFSHISPDVDPENRMKAAVKRN